MSFIKLGPDAFDSVTLLARPKRQYVSSSSGVTGSLRIYPQSSLFEKASTPFNDSYTELSVESRLADVVLASTGTSFANSVSQYMDAVRSSSVSGRASKSVGVIRFTPPFSFNSDTLKKGVIRNVLYPFYRSSYPSINWGYTNYLSLRFPESIGPSSSSIAYPNPTGSTGNTWYIPTSSFTIESYVKQPYRESTAGIFTAATLLHVSSSLALSIVSGSSRDGEGHVNAYKVMLQLSHSADLHPSSLTANGPSAYPSDLVFVSNDNVIKKNKWHHVAIRWSPSVNFGTGSFLVDGIDAGTFVIPSSTLMQLNAPLRAGALVVGNYVQGRSVGDGLTGLFNAGAVTDEGVTNAFTASSLGPFEPSTFSFTSPYRGELHELRIWDEYRNIDYVLSGTAAGVPLSSSLLFYLPPFFTRAAPPRSVLKTPFVATNKSTDDPFNVDMSFGVGGHLINIENHLREFKRGAYPRLLFMTASTVVSQDSTGHSANEYIYATGSNVRRNMLVAPCDNGLFVPRFDLLLTGTVSTRPSTGSLSGRFVDQLGTFDSSLVDLSSMVFTGSLVHAVSASSLGSYLAGSSPETLSTSPGSELSILQRTRDASSDMVTIFDVSNVLYGSRIYPGSVKLFEHSVSGSNGTMTTVIRDDGVGGLYRADSEPPHAKWSRVGAVFYNEGILTVTSPYLGELFGVEGYTLDITGERPVHVQEMLAIAPKATLTTSSNPTYKSLYSSGYANDTSKGFVYLKSMALHDENLNVLGRAEFVDPFPKRPDDRIAIRLKVDF